MGAVSIVQILKKYVRRGVERVGCRGKENIKIRCIIFVALSYMEIGCDSILSMFR